MNISVKRSVQIAALTAVFSASGAGMALASTGPATSGNSSILGGNQISLPISIPVNVCGNALALLGDAVGACQGGASASGGSTGGGTTSGNHSIGGGNQVSVPISVPVNVCGNSVAALGHAKSGCKGGASTSGGSGGGSTTSGNHSIGGGNQVSVPITVPVDVCGISVAVLGDAASSCQGGSHSGPPPGRHHHHHTPPPGHHHHHHHTPPPGHHHHHGGSGTTVTSTQTPPSSGGSLPTTGANFLGLLALAGGVTLSGAGCTFLAKRGLLRGVLAVTRRAASTVMAR
jgi:small secreted domain DUF320